MSRSNYNLDLSHSNVDLTSAEFKGKIEKIKKTPVPNFAKYVPDLAKLKELRKKYADKKNIIVEGNGGAISNFRGIYGALKEKSDKNVYLLDTGDPDRLEEIKRKCDPEDSLAILTSKSGTRIQVLANYFALKDYPLLIITEDNAGALNEIRKMKNLDVSFYPAVNMTDRYTGLTESALTSAEIVGIDTEDIVRGGKEMYAQCSPLLVQVSDLNQKFLKTQQKKKCVVQVRGSNQLRKESSNYNFENNPALQLALTLDKLENLGYSELFLSIYSKKLSGFFELITQLFHEGVCKNGVGQTIYGGEAPENQHHTLQRLIAGRKNSAGLFVTVKKHFYGENIKIDVEKDLKNIVCRNIALKNLDGVSLEKIIWAEFEGTWQDAVENKIPAIHLEIENISPHTVGGFMAFFQYAAFYSALLRGVNPCDQPGVEKSKENIFNILSRKL